MIDGIAKAKLKGSIADESFIFSSLNMINFQKGKRLK